MWPEALPSNSLVVLSGADVLVDARAVSRWTQHRHSPQQLALHACDARAPSPAIMSSGNMPANSGV